MAAYPVDPRDTAPVDAPGTRSLQAEDVWLSVLVVATAVLASEEWGTAGAIAAAATAAGVATVRAGAAPWPVSLAALATAGAAAIHFAVAFPHLREWWVYGIFFVATGWLQLAWSALSPRSADRRLLWAGAAGNLAVVMLWGTTRSTGLPFGPEPGEAEAISASDAIATALEALAVAGCAVALVTHAPSVHAARWPLAACVAAVTTYALVSATGAH